MGLTTEERSPRSETDGTGRDDPRAERSRKALRQALISLIRVKDYDDIQIAEITDQADTAKVTFYRHYRNKDELLIDVIKIGYQQIKPLMGSARPFDDVTDLNAIPPTLPLFLLLEADRLLFKRLLQSPKMALILHEFREIALHQIKLNTPDFSEFDAQQIVSCITGNMVWWMLNDVPYSAEQMARITHWVSMTGVMGLRGELDRLLMPSPELVARTTAANST